jgi:hypothetical protein
MDLGQFACRKCGGRLLVSTSKGPRQGNGVLPYSRGLTPPQVLPRRLGVLTWADRSCGKSGMRVLWLSSPFPTVNNPRELSGPRDAVRRRYHTPALPLHLNTKLRYGYGGLKPTCMSQSKHQQAPRTHAKTVSWGTAAFPGNLGPTTLHRWYPNVRHRAGAAGLSQARSAVGEAAAVFARVTISIPPPMPFVPLTEAGDMSSPATHTARPFFLRVLSMSNASGSCL